MFSMRKRLLPVLAISISVFSSPLSYAGPGDLNSINDGLNIQSGTYLNTPGSRTTFQNTAGGGLWLHSGDLVRGIESTAAKVPTGNGGTLLFSAPNNVVRLDGNIDVSAVRNGTLYTGNGGKVLVDSGYLFQNGNIFANGVNGGLVQFNVGGMTLGANAQINAQGFGGAGGSISINSPGTVDLRTGSIIDTSGKVIGTFDTNIINIEGSAVNNQGFIRANGVAAADTKPDNGDAAVMAAHPQLANNPVPAPISAGNGTHDTATMQNVLFGTPGSADFRGGTIRLIAGGFNNSTTAVVNSANSQMLSDADKSALNNRNNQIVQFNEGDVLNRGAVIADGTLSKNGGTIIVGASRNAVNSGTLRANGADGIDGFFDATGNGGNGGNGGTIAVTAKNIVSNTATIQANGGQGARAQSLSVSTANGKDANATVNGTGGTGGQGGLIAFSDDTMSNSGNIIANGGKGGFGGHANTFDTESATASNANPVANATSHAGQGGVGGQGGLVVFSGNANPSGSGAVQANGGQGGRGGNAWADAVASSNTGTPKANTTVTVGAGGVGGSAGAVIAPTPGSFTTATTKAGGQGDTGFANFRQRTIVNEVTTTTTGNTPQSLGTAITGGNQAILATRMNEYLRHQDTALLFTQTGGVGTANTTLSGRLNDTLLRTVGNPTGISGAGGASLSNADTVGNFVVGSTSTGLSLTNDVVNSNVNPIFFNLNTLTILNKGDLTNNTFWTPGVHVVGQGFHDLELAVGGGHISWLTEGSIINNQIVATRGQWSGGSTHLATTLDIVNNKDFINIAPNKALLSGFTLAGPDYESSHAGALTLKSGRDIVNSNTGKIETNLIFFDIHPPLNQNPPIDWPKFLNGAQIGATVNLLAGRNLTNSGLIGADALTYRHGQAGVDNPALTMGGTVIGRARTGLFSNSGTITANGNAFFSASESDGPRFNTNTFPATTSFNGLVDIH
jgi:hypothetical protein